MNHERLYVGVNQNHTRLTNLFTLCSSLRSKRGLPPFGRDGHPSLDGTSIQPQQQPCQMSLTMAHMDAEVRLSTCQHIAHCFLQSFSGTYCLAPTTCVIVTLRVI